MYITFSEGLLPRQGSSMVSDELEKALVAGACRGTRGSMF